MRGLEVSFGGPVLATALLIVTIALAPFTEHIGPYMAFIRALGYPGLD